MEGQILHSITILEIKTSFPLADQTKLLRHAFNLQQDQKMLDLETVIQQDQKTQHQEIIPQGVLMVAADHLAEVDLEVADLAVGMADDN
jgi:hypothetical protein